MTIKKKRVWNIPNILSLSRIAVVPVLVALLGLGGHRELISKISAVIFLIAVLTDLVDGYLARRFQLVTNLGRFLDPLADKLINAGVMVMLIPLGRIQAWVVFFILAREMAITGLRSIAASEGVVISASSWGKQKTLTQNIALFCLIWHFSFLGLDLQAIGNVLIYFALAATYWSGYNYLKEFYSVFQEKTSEKGLDNPDGN